MAIHSFCNIHSYKKRKTSQGDFSIECGAQLALQAAPKINEWKIVSICCPNHSIVIYKPQNGAVGI
jgi:hypothetical protein